MVRDSNFQHPLSQGACADLCASSAGSDFQIQPERRSELFARISAAEKAVAFCQSCSIWFAVGKFLAEHILGKPLVKLIWTQEGWAPLQDEATGEPVLSLALASAFVGGDNRLYVSGSLARIANEHGMVFVMFSDQQARGVTRTAWCDDVLREHAEEHSRDPLKSAGSLKKRARGTGASDENTPVTTPASKCQRRCLNMPALPHTLTAPPTPLPGVDSPFLCRCLIWGRTSWKGSVNLCWGPLKVKVMSGRPDSYILRCGHCNALYREADVSRLPRRYAYCSSTVDVLPRRRVRSISCPR